LARELPHGERGPLYRRLPGFQDGDISSPSTFRMSFSGTTWEQFCFCEDSLVIAFIAYGLTPSSSTFPEVPPENGISLSADCRLIQSRSHGYCNYLVPVCSEPATSRS
jgi:hypothetical protein